MFATVNLNSKDNTSNTGRYSIMLNFNSCTSCLPSFSRRTRCSWQETKVWNPGATPKPSWSMNGGSSCVWIWTLIPASNEVSSVDKNRSGHLQHGWWWFVCTHRPRPPWTKHSSLFFFFCWKESLVGVIAYSLGSSTYNLTWTTNTLRSFGVNKIRIVEWKDKSNGLSWVLDDNMRPTGILFTAKGKRDWMDKLINKWWWGWKENQYSWQLLSLQHSAVWIFNKADEPLWYRDRGNITMTRWLKPILCKHTVFLSHLQRPGTAYRGDGRLYSRDLVSLSTGLGIK